VAQRPYVRRAVVRLRRVGKAAGERVADIEHGPDGVTRGWRSPC
jgi:hypothetical protein